MNSACLGGVLASFWRRHLGAWLDSSLFHSHDHHNKSKGMCWPTKFWCPVGTCHCPGGCKGRSSGCPASWPANDPTVAGPACLQHCQPGLAQSASNSQSLLCPANDHAASSTGHHPSSEKAAANYRAHCPRQKPGQESQPPSTPHPLALMLRSPPLPSRVMKDTAEVGAPGARKPPPLTGGKTGPQKGADSPKSQSQPVQGPWP